MKNPTSSTDNSVPRFAKNSQGFCVDARGRCFATQFDARSCGDFFVRSLPQNFAVGVHKTALSATWRVILQTGGLILPASDAILWRGNAILPTGRVILQTVGVILCTVGAVLRRFYDILRAAPCSAVASVSATTPSQAEDAPEFPEIAETHSAIRATTRALLRTRPHKAVSALVPRFASASPSPFGLRFARAISLRSVATALQIRTTPLSLNY